MMAPKSTPTEASFTKDNGNLTVDLQPGVTDARERRIQRSGIWQSVASNPALIGYAADLEALQVVIQTLSEAGLKWVNNVA